MTADKSTDGGRSRILIMMLGVIGAGLVAAFWWTRASPEATDDRPKQGRPAVVPSTQVAAGWHAETWRDLQLFVPNTWGYGDLRDWCTTPGTIAPVVDRPGERDLSSRCASPRFGYGVRFLSDDVGREVGALHRTRPAERQLFPADAWVGVGCARCEVAVLVVAPTQFVGQYLMRSVTPFELVDVHGCPPERRAERVAGGPGAVTLCWYDGGRLEASTQLTGAEADSAQRTLAAIRSDPGWTTDCRASDGAASLLATSDGATSILMLEGPCRGAFDDRGRPVGALGTRLPPWTRPPT